MQTSIKSFVSLCAIYFLASGLALAEPADVSITEDGCALLNENEVPVGGGDSVSISANNDNGNITLTCSKDLPPTTSGRSVIFNYDNTTDPDDVTLGRTCRVSKNPEIRTEDWHQVISAMGKAKLTCHYKK